MWKRKKKEASAAGHDAEKEIVSAKVNKYSMEGLKDRKVSAENPYTEEALFGKKQEPPKNAYEALLQKVQKEDVESIRHTNERWKYGILALTVLCISSGLAALVWYYLPQQQADRYNRTGVEAFQAGEYWQAEGDFLQAIALTGQDRTVVDNLADTYITWAESIVEEDPGKAYELYKKAWQHKSGNKDILFSIQRTGCRYAEKAFISREYDTAYRVYAEVKDTYEGGFRVKESLLPLLEELGAYNDNVDEKLVKQCLEAYKILAYDEIKDILMKEVCYKNSNTIGVTYTGAGRINGWWDLEEAIAVYKELYIQFRTVPEIKETYEKLLAFRKEYEIYGPVMKEISAKMKARDYDGLIDLYRGEEIQGLMEQMEKEKEYDGEWLSSTYYGFSLGGTYLVFEDGTLYQNRMITQVPSFAFIYAEAENITGNICFRLDYYDKDGNQIKEYRFTGEHSSYQKKRESYQGFSLIETREGDEVTFEKYIVKPEEGQE